jgi:hypothetical protein
LHRDPAEFRLARRYLFSSQAHGHAVERLAIAA